MNKEKLTYLSPETETLVVQAEGNVLVAPSNPQVLSLLGTFGEENKAGDDLIVDDGFNF